MYLFQLGRSGTIPAHTMWRWSRPGMSHAGRCTLTGWLWFCSSFTCWSPTSCSSTCSSPCSGKRTRRLLSVHLSPWLSSPHGNSVCVHSATPSRWCRRTATSTGNSSATTWLFSTTPVPRWRLPSSSSLTSICLSRGRSARCPPSRSTILVSATIDIFKLIESSYYTFIADWNQKYKLNISVTATIYWLGWGIIVVEIWFKKTWIFFSQCCSFEGKWRTGWWRGKPFRRRTSSPHRPRSRRAATPRGSKGCRSSECPFVHHPTR